MCFVDSLLLVGMCVFLTAASQAEMIKACPKEGAHMGIIGN